MSGIAFIQVNKCGTHLTKNKFGKAYWDKAAEKAKTGRSKLSEMFWNYVMVSAFSS